MQRLEEKDGWKKNAANILTTITTQHTRKNMGTPANYESKKNAAAIIAEATESTARNSDTAEYEKVNGPIDHRCHI